MNKNERWFVTHEIAEPLCLSLNRLSTSYIDYTYIEGGVVQIIKKEDMRGQITYYRKCNDVAEPLSGKESQAARLHLAEHTKKVVRVINNHGRYRNRPGISVWFTRYSGPNERSYAITKLAFNSRYAAREFQPPQSLGVEVMDKNDWSGFALWSKLIC